MVADNDDVHKGWGMCQGCCLIVACRDAAIQLATEMFATKKKELRQLRSALDAQARFMDNEQANNNEVEARIEHMERQVHKLRDTFAAEQHALSEAADEVDIMRNTLTKTGGQLAAELETNGHTRCSLMTVFCLYACYCWAGLGSAVPYAGAETVLVRCLPSYPAAGVSPVLLVFSWHSRARSATGQTKCEKSHGFVGRYSAVGCCVCSRSALSLSIIVQHI